MSNFENYKNKQCFAFLHEIEYGTLFNMYDLIRSILGSSTKSLIFSQSCEIQ